MTTRKFTSEELARGRTVPALKSFAKPRTHGKCARCSHYGSDCHCHLHDPQQEFEFIAQIARLTTYEYEDGSWTDDQAEDAIVTLNRLIAKARKLSRPV